MVRHYEVPNIDKLENRENKRSERAKRLLEMIESDLDPSDFTLEEIKDSFNAQTKLSKDLEETNFGAKDIKTLIENGYIQEFNKGHYEVINSIEN